jgi:serine/threonine protein kinase
VDVDLMDTVTLTNNQKDKISFKIASRATDKCALTFDPSSGTVHPGKALSIAVKLMVKCTTIKLSPDIALVMWKGHLKDLEKSTRRTYSNFSMSLESQLTTKLDKDELSLYPTPVGDGSYGTVWQGKWRGMEVAVKVLKRQDCLTADMLEEFNSEVEMMEKLRHPCVINFVGAVRVPGHLAIITEFCDYGNLNTAIRKNKLTWALKLKCLYDCARGMDFLHRSNILHRDLKPDNLLMVSMEVRSPVVCKISDFGTTRGVNRYAEGVECTRGVGTPIFMAPEVLSGSTYEKPADVYSFALMMHNVVSDKTPYSDDSDFTKPFQFAQLVIQGKRPKIQAGWPDTFVALMCAGWSRTPGDRLAFSDIVPRVDDMLKKEVAKIPRD